MYSPIKITVDGIPMQVDGDLCDDTPSVIVSVGVIENTSADKLSAAMAKAVEVARFSRAVAAAWSIMDLGLDYLLQDGGELTTLRRFVDEMRPWRGRRLLGRSIDETLSLAELAVERYESQQNGLRVKRAACLCRRREFAIKRPRIVLALIERDGYACAECGKSKSLHVDHVRPLSRGGTDDLDNLRFLCASCNSRKGDRCGR